MHFWLHAQCTCSGPGSVHTHSGHDRQTILSGGPLHPLTFELRQRGELDRSGVSAILRGALGFSLLLCLPHGLPRKPIHFL